MYTKHYTVGFVRNGDSVLLKQALRGISEGKLLGIGGK